MQLGKQTDISSADKHMLKTGKRRLLTGMPQDADTQELRVCTHTSVSTCAPARPDPAGLELQLSERLSSECHLIRKAGDLQG